MPVLRRSQTREREIEPLNIQPKPLSPIGENQQLSSKTDKNVAKLNSTISTISVNNRRRKSASYSTEITDENKLPVPSTIATTRTKNVQKKVDDTKPVPSTTSSTYRRRPSASSTPLITNTEVQVPGTATSLRMKKINNAKLNTGPVRKNNSKGVENINNPVMPSETPTESASCLSEIVESTPSFWFAEPVRPRQPLKQDGLSWATFFSIIIFLLVIAACVSPRKQFHYDKPMLADHSGSCRNQDENAAWRWRVSELESKLVEQKMFHEHKSSVLEKSSRDQISHFRRRLFQVENTNHRLWKQNKMLVALLRNKSELIDQLRESMKDIVVIENQSSFDDGDDLGSVIYLVNCFLLAALAIGFFLLHLYHTSGVKTLLCFPFRCMENVCIFVLKKVGFINDEDRGVRQHWVKHV